MLESTPVVIALTGVTSIEWELSLSLHTHRHRRFGVEA